MHVSKCGNSLAIRLPAVVVDAMKPHEGDHIEVVIADLRVLRIARKPNRETLLARLRLFRGKLPTDFRFERDEANDCG